MKMKRIINLTPHDVVIIRRGEVAATYPFSGWVAKLIERDSPAGSLDGFPVVRKDYGEVVIMTRSDFLSKVESPHVEPMPAVSDEEVYIVPMLVGQALAGQRDDLYGPDFGIGGVRTADGAICGAVGFILY